MPIFSDDLKNVAIGHDKKQGSDKFFGGGFSSEDAVRGPLTTEAEAAYACGLREVYEEAGITKKQLSIYTQIGEPVIRTVNHRETGERILLSRYTFLAVAKEGIILPEHTKGEAEMGNRRFVPVISVLRAGLLPRDHSKKFNPHHAQILAETLLAIRTMASDGNPGYDQFFSLLHGLKLCGFDINWYTSRIGEEIRQRRV